MMICEEVARPLLAVPSVEDLYVTYAPWVYRQLLARVGGRHEEAEDLLHEVFVRVVQAYPRVRTPFYPKAWLSVILGRLVIDWLRRRGLGGADIVSLSVLDAEEEPEDPAIKVAEQVEAAEEVGQALSACPSHERAALALLAQGYSYQEIAAGLGWKLTRTKAVICRGRERIRVLAALSEVGHD